jgi:cysteine desulfurase
MLQVAALINCTPDEVCFTSCGTESDNWALWGAVMARRSSMQQQGLPHVVTSQIEHPAVTACLRSMADMVSLMGQDADVWLTEC